MFEVVKKEMANKTFRMPVELIERLSNTAQEKNVSVNALVVQCCEYALNNMVDNKTDKEKSK